MRGRKHGLGVPVTLEGTFIKKESPNEGTETIIANNTATARIANKKRIPE